MFSFETNVGTGKGMIRLVCLPNGAWMAHMIYTALQELHSAKEIAGYNRPHGGNNSLKGGAVEGNWYERRERKKERPTTSCEEIDERHTYSTVKEPFDRDGISTRSHGGGAVTAE